MSIRYHVAGFRKWVRLVRRYGLPHILLYFYGGIGDQLLCSAVARELQRRRPQRLWFFTQAPELFADNPDFAAVLPLEPAPAPDTPGGQRALQFDLSLVPWARLSGATVHRTFYQGYVDGEDRDMPLVEPCIAALCRRVGLTGEITLRPYLGGEFPRPAPSTRPRIALQSSCLTARYPIANKQWPVERMAEVAHALVGEADLVQLGSEHDPLLPGVVDRRGCGLLAAARELSACHLFVGLVGFLMHLARAVDCPSVIVYGGREPPEITGYSCNANLAERPPCAPCWQYSRCDHERRCLTAISAAQVIDAVRAKLIALPSRPLPAGRFVIAAA